ncbi:hypothetical protein [Sphingomonas astaxanthinifaciens]|uniref:Uncharacterized protein n=1 Tax=Sphingomonas astaxanthinifaciens DSM 22298 TaxID=1123267 RepID=A0ABQ5Z9V8_9SPHN|nr:hypothetical protein [Sphingomonas astaxanthinifaciens]GLR48266.1 hypothetical protein GCM10007925_19800 [Sphingomonas astaxanthinifaciens DSM 22298]
MASLPLTLPEPARAASPAPRLTLVASQPAPEPARLSAFDWSIVALAEHDSLASLREPGRLAKAMEMLFGLGQPNKLANSRSETLRRIAVWAWRRGWTIPQSEIDAFVEAGFTLAQLELIQASIAQGRNAARVRRRSR